jgi:hypothetical protein
VPIARTRREGRTTGSTRVNRAFTGTFPEFSPKFLDVLAKTLAGLTRRDGQHEQRGDEQKEANLLRVDFIRANTLTGPGLAMGCRAQTTRGLPSQPPSGSFRPEHVRVGFHPIVPPRQGEYCRSFGQPHPASNAT